MDKSYLKCFCLCFLHLKYLSKKIYDKNCSDTLNIYTNIAYAIDFQNLTQIYSQSLIEEVESEDMRKLLKTFTEKLGGSQLDPGFF